MSDSNTETARPIHDSTARAAKARTRKRVLLWSSWIGITLLLLVSMEVLNAVAGKLVMPSPVDVVREGVGMTLDGTIPRALGQSLTVLMLGYLLAAVTGIGIGIFLAQRLEGAGNVIVADALLPELSSYHPRGIAPSVQAGCPGFGIGPVIEQAGV